MMSLGKEFSIQPAQKTRTGMTFMPLTTPDGGPVSFLLGESQTFPAQVPFEPSVFGGGVGHEQRKSIRFELDDDVLEGVRDFEHEIQKLLPSSSGWNSCVADPTAKFSGSLKAKIFVTGEKACIVRDEDGKVIAMPGQPWARPRANARILVKGVYRQSSTSCGLILHVTHLHLSNKHQDRDEPDPST